MVPPRESGTCDLLDFTADRSTIGKSAVHSVAMQLLFRCKGLITMPILTYYLTPAEFGVFSILLATSSMLVPLFSMNLTDGPAIHFVHEESKPRIVVMYNTVINGSLLFSALFTIVFYAVMHFFGGAYSRYTFLVLLLLYSNLAYKLITYVLAIFQKTSMLVRNTFLRDGTATLLTVASVAAGYSYIGMTASLVVTNVAAAALVYRKTRKELPYSPCLDRDVLSRFLKTSLPLLPVFFFSWVVQSSDSWFLAVYRGAAVVGKYSVIYGLAGILLTLTFALNFFWFPVSARLWVEDREKYRRAFVALFAGFVTVLFLAVLLFELNSAALMRLVVRRPEYQDANGIMGIIAFAFAMQVLITLLTAPLYSNGNTKSIFASYLSGGVVNTALNIFLIPSSGILGAAVSTAVSYLVIVLLMSWMSYRVAGFSFLDRRLLPVGLLFPAAWAASAWLRPSLSVPVLLAADIALVSYVGLLVYAKALRNEEREYLHGMFRDLLTRQGAKA
ncbi:MAG: polysaccharide biosynthesis C-terminal domain-containing protein [Candidatus Deferrimicrobium sp.]